MQKILSIIGARPQFIKAAAISRSIAANYSDSIEEIIIHTGQHYDPGMSQVFFKEMKIPAPKYNLNIGSGSHGSQTGDMLKAIEEVIISEKPNGVLVYGDTNSTLAGALAASKLHYPVIHVEAGLRSYNKKMPEEINRIMTDHVSTLLFSPTQTGIDNLVAEGLNKANNAPYGSDNPGIFNSGDIMYDNTLFFKDFAEKKASVFNQFNIDKNNFVLATIHRPANTDSPDVLSEIFEAIIDICNQLHTNVVLPVHPRTKSSIEKLDKNLKDKLTQKNGIYLIPAVSFLEMMQLESNANLILTDSGGVQKEAWFMKKPVVILRSESEWVEIINHGNGKLAGHSKEKIIAYAEEFLNNPPSEFPNIYGNGNASGKILDIVSNSLWR